MGQQAARSVQTEPHLQHAGGQQSGAACRQQTGSCCPLCLACSSKSVRSSSSCNVARASCSPLSSDLVRLKSDMIVSRFFSATASFLSRSCSNSCCHKEAYPLSVRLGKFQCSCKTKCAK